MNRLTNLFQTKSNNILNVYFTAGFPNLNDTVPILEALEASGVDLIEIGMPYSDPIADGPTIQESNQVALNNGMTIKLLFEQLAGMRAKINVPIVLMGYLNPVLQFGIEAFCQKCQEVGIDGLILPDLPITEYKEEYKAIFDKYNLLNTFLITPQTTENRIRQIDELTEGFIYVVSSSSITGAKSGISENQENYFERINAMNLKNPRLIGFGISDNKTFTKACQYAQGAIIGSAFIKALEQNEDIYSKTAQFVKSILN